MKHQFKDLTANTLFCQRCGVAQPVRERLLLVLPDHDLHEYRCTVCFTSVGTRKVGRHAEAKISLR
jgi:hypothetical protein